VIRACVIEIVAGWRHGRSLRDSRFVLALLMMRREPSPDGDTDGSRWSRAKRETTGSRTRTIHDRGSGRGGIHAAWYLIRDP